MGDLAFISDSFRERRRGHDGDALGAADHAGKKTFAQVPAKLREQVRELLVDSGVGELAE